jgi:hypothetical protein
MGAFLLVSARAVDFNREAAINLIRKQCNSEPLKYALPGWTLFHFPKELVKTPNFINKGENSLFAAGTPYIPGRSYSDSLNFILRELNDEKIPGEISGLFFLLHRKKDNLGFMTDPYGIYSIWHTSDGTVISSSFLALAEGLPFLNADRSIITENLLTGTVTGSDTIFTEIKRYEPGNLFKFSGLEFYLPGHSKGPDNKVFRSRKESLSAQIEAMDTCFSGMEPLVNEFGADSGITGGYDSRLLLAMCIRHFKKELLQFHSHMRKTPDNDFISGKEICSSAGLKFIDRPVLDFTDAGEGNVREILEAGMTFCDGQVRTHSFWHEAFNSSEYRRELLGNKRTGFSGIGGEQFRNADHYFSPGWNRRKWIMYDLVLKYCGKSAAGRQILNELTRSIESKIRTRLGTEGAAVNLTEIKRYMHEIYIPANRGLRSSNENRLSFFLLPFTDRNVAETAFKAVNFLGISNDYEGDLIKMINPEIAGIRTSYSYSFDKGEPAVRKLSLLLINNFLPGSLRHVLIENKYASNSSQWENILGNFSILRESLNAIVTIELPVNFNELIKRKDLGPLVFAMGYMLKKYSGKIRYTDGQIL